MFSKLCRIGNDPTVRFTQAGDAVLGLSLAYGYGRKGEDGKRPTQWLEAAIFGKQAEAVKDYLHKGDQISVSVDDIHVETYEKKDGSNGVKLAGRIVSFDFVSGKREESEPRQQSEPVATTKSEPKKSGSFDDFEDDLLPF